MTNPSLANMIPQAPNLNRGIWAKSIESATRKYVMRTSGDVFVFTGSFFEKPVSTIGASRVWVPSHVYKLVYDADKNQAWAHWVENKDDAKMTKPISYEELVKRVGIEFLVGIKPSLGAAETIPSVLTVPVADASAACGGKRTCKQMSDCAEARHYLVDCGVKSLDGDGDGMPCESLCR
ncbi:hypothetical protein CKO12_12645 [Chromatium okenii]|uniref:DNA/RNA non-specific endonuclease n=1 Tax=Chromatium okenii TaxID=61644 RepID=UPI001902D2A7|nr:DNA/RNA non-specific endonuclease [Chromatium okenii]MBK1642702.1 hypothetical protein [Chromatium okenii]